ncbi:MAG: recombinase family protein [Alphaproteobacteria bacterium]|nr:recombinase family protein [Alphaproteobacteria bacterium]
MAQNHQNEIGRRIGYARVSTDKQTTEQQIAELRRAGCKKVFVDEGISATAKLRPALMQARETLKNGDIFVVWAIDRAFRSTLDAIIFLDSIDSDGVAFLSLTQNIDTRTPEGRKWFIDTASWAEYERAMISRRTKLKMADAKRRGVKLGRPHRLTPKVTYRAFKKINCGKESITSCAKKLSVSSITLTRAFKRLGLIIQR